MRYRWQDLPALARTPVGRSQIRKGIRRRLWPFYARAARLHRRTRARRCRIVAVVGSFGKTTTTRAVAIALGLDPPERGGNFYVPLARQILAIRPGDRHAVVEAGISHPGQMAPYARVVRPDITVATHIGNTHQDRLHTLENTAHEKAFMVRALPASGIAVLNGDDPRVMAMAAETGARVVTFGLGPDCDVRATDIRTDPSTGTRLTLHVDGETREVGVRLLGEQAVHPVLAAIAVARTEGRPLDAVLDGLARLGPAAGRTEVLRLADGRVVLRDDSKSAIASIYLALDVFERLQAERRLAVLVEPVDEMAPDGEVFPPLGARLAEAVDQLFFVGTAARFDQLRRGAAGRVPNGDAWQRIEPDVVRIVERLKPLFRPGDALLLKGPGTARLDRIVLAFQERIVRCRAPSCDARFKCSSCPMLEPGWGSRRIVI